jgi:hypothetical protein
MLTRITAARLKPWLPDLLQKSQYYGIQGQSFFDALATIRNAIIYAEETKNPFCVISSDFKRGF